MAGARTDAVAYKSPLLEKFDTEGRITMEQMRREVPPYQEGRAAFLELKDSNKKFTAKQRRDLEAKVIAGDASKERLTKAGIALVKSLAQKEYKRRQSWQSSVTFEDLFQDAMIGYLRGLLSYDPTGDYKSPTNYLGQWIITEMRRSSEPMDNDFEVSHEASERFRRIRAVRSRLAGELGRTPTSEEIVTASAEPVVGSGNLMGRVGRGGKPKPLTLEQVEEERSFSQRVGYTSRIAPANEDDGSIEPGTVLADYAQPVLGTAIVDGSIIVVEQSVSEGLSTVILLTMDSLGMSPEHQEIVSRRFGLAPFTDEQSVREIAREMNMTSTAVSNVVEAFQHEMNKPHGQFHKVCAALDQEVLNDYGLGWVPAALGEYDYLRADNDVHEHLVAPVKRKSSSPAPPKGVLSTGFYGQFLCDYHDRTFTARYRSKGDIPKTHPCPSCRRPSRLIRTAAAA